MKAGRRGCDVAGEGRPASRRAVAATLAVVLALAASPGCAGDGDDEDEAAGVVAAGAGEVYVPGPLEAAGITAVDRIEVGDPVYDTLHGTGPLVVTEVEGAVVGVVAAPRSTIEAAWGTAPGALAPDPRVPDIAGRPTVAALGDLIAAPTPAESLAWQATDDTVVAVASRDTDLTGLALVAGLVQVGPDGELTVPGTEIGRIPRPWNAPQPSVRVRYGADDVVVHTATPSVQAAYRALLHDDPASTIDPAVEAGCCQPEIMTPTRTVELGDRTVVLGTLTTTTRALIVEGDPGAVLLAEVGIGVADDETLLALAESLTAVPEAEVDDHLAALGPAPADAPR